MATSTALTSTPLMAHPKLKLLASGKVREVYEIDESSLLFVTTDRISAFDRVMTNGIPRKGELLTRLSCWWFMFLKQEMPELKTHFVAMGLPDSLTEGSLSDGDVEALNCRCMVTKRLEVLKIEAIVRGYITGSAYASYKKDGTVNGKRLPAGLQESSRLEQPIYTPSTKADAGEHDENISEEEAARIVGEEYADRVKSLSLAIYQKASEYAASRGIILADTKFEFGLDNSTTPHVVLIDEVLTPDSSRFWSAEDYIPGRPQSSFDKQILRDWLIETGQRGTDGVEMPQDVINSTAKKYFDAYHMLTGEKL